MVVSVLRDNDTLGSITDKEFFDSGVDLYWGDTDLNPCLLTEYPDTIP
jgi:hypothetical protein